MMQFLSDAFADTNIVVTQFLECLNDAGFYIAPLEQRPHDSTVYRDGEMRVM